MVRGALRVIRGRSVRARGCALALLRELLAAAPGCLADHAAKVIRALTPALTLVIYTLYKADMTDLFALA